MALTLEALDRNVKLDHQLDTDRLRFVHELARLAFANLPDGFLSRAALIDAGKS